MNLTTSSSATPRRQHRPAGGNRLRRAVAIAGAAALVWSLVSVIQPAAATFLAGPQDQALIQSPNAANAAVELENETIDLIPDGSDWYNEFNILASRIEEENIADFAYSIVHSDGAGAIHFRADVPQSALDLVRDTPGVTLVAGAGFGNRELEDFVAGLVNAGASIAHERRLSIAASPDQVAKSIDIAIGPAPVEQPGGRPQDLDEARDAILTFASAHDLSSVFDIRFESVDAPVAVTEAYDGGRVLAGVCTGSFSIKKNGGPELGVLTAGHCPGTGSYDGVANAFHPVVPFSLATTTTYPGGDFRWNHSKHMFTGYTYVGASGTPRRQFSSASTPSLDSPVCNYGKTTGYKCSTVAQTGKTATIWIPDGGAMYTVGPLRCTASHITAGGDSGGPWFYNYVAYGIHSGHYHGGSCWSSVPYALTRFGVSLWTG